MAQRQRWYVMLHNWLWAFLSDPVEVIALLLIAGFSVAYVQLGFSNYADFSTGIDLAGYNQALWNLIHGRLPLNSFKGFVMWGDHAHFILVFMAPLYALWQDARMILAIQALAFTTSGWALWRVACALTKSRFFSLALLYSYLAFVGIQYALNFDFHPSVLTAAAISWLLYAWYFKRWRVYWVVLGLGLITREDAPTILFMLGGWLLLAELMRHIWQARGSLRTRIRQVLRAGWRTPLSHGVSVGLLTAVISISYFFLVGYVIMPIWTPDGTALVYLESDDKNPLNIIRGFYAYPDALIQNMFDTAEKRATIHTLAYSFSYLPLLSPFTWLTAAPIMYARFTGGSDYRWLLTNHSNANIAPILAFGALFGAYTIVALLRLSKQQWLVRGAWLALGLLLVISVQMTAWSDVRVPLRVSGREDWEAAETELVARRSAFWELAERIPSDVGVTAASGFTAHLAQRSHIINYPELPAASEWIITSHKVWAWPFTEGPMRLEIEWLLEQPEWELVAEQDEVWLFQRVE